jgi:hypothetical protein
MAANMEAYPVMGKTRSHISRILGVTATLANRTIRALPRAWPVEVTVAWSRRGDESGETDADFVV